MIISSRFFPENFFKVISIDNIFTSREIASSCEMLKYRLTSLTPPYISQVRDAAETSCLEFGDGPMDQGLYRHESLHRHLLSQ